MRPAFRGRRIRIPAGSAGITMPGPRQHRAYSPLARRRADPAIAGRSRRVTRRLGDDRAVLLVYGRNEAVKEKVARFLMQLGLEPVLLDEQEARGRTLIEKLDQHPRVASA